MSVVGDLFSGKQEQKSSSKTKTTPFFDHLEGLEPLALSFVDRARDRVETPFRDQGFDVLSSLAAGEPMDFNISDPLEGLITNIREQADQSLPDELAQARSQYFRAPAGRSAMALDETLLNNRIRRDQMINNLLQNQFNTDRNTVANAANNLLTGEFGEQQLDLNVLSALAGNNQIGSSRGVSRDPARGVAAIGSLASGLGDLGFSPFS